MYCAYIKNMYMLILISYFQILNNQEGDMDNFDIRLKTKDTDTVSASGKFKYSISVTSDAAASTSNTTVTVTTQTDQDQLNLKLSEKRGRYFQVKWKYTFTKKMFQKHSVRYVKMPT